MRFLRKLRAHQSQYQPISDLINDHTKLLETVSDFPVCFSKNSTANQTFRFSAEKLLSNSYYNKAIATTNGKSQMFSSSSYINVCECNFNSLSQQYVKAGQMSEIILCKF